MPRPTALLLTAVVLAASCTKKEVPSVCVEGFAGLDAGAGDAGDAGSADAGDAGVHDAGAGGAGTGTGGAGAGDAGLGDAGVDDAGTGGTGGAGTGDAGLGGAGTGGAGPGDAGVHDAGAHDAGAADGGTACSACAVPASCGTVQSASVSGPTGIAASALHAGAYYLVNGDPDVQARFFAMDQTGTDLGTYTLSAGATFWGDVAVGACPLPGGSCLFLADIADATRARATYAVYRVAEPSVLTEGTTTVTTQVDAFSFTYPDGPHDGTTILVDPGTRLITIVTRDGIPFELPALPATPSAQPLVAVRKGPIGRGLAAGVTVTGGSVRSDGRGLLLRTSVGALFYPAAPPKAGGSAVTVALTGATPCPMTMASETDGEAIAWMGSGRGFVTLDHATSATLHYVFCTGF